MPSPPILPASPEFADRPTAADAAYEIGTLDDTERLTRFLAIFRHFRLIDQLRADRDAGRLDIDTYSWEVFNAIADILPGFDDGSLRTALGGIQSLSPDLVAEPATQGTGEPAGGAGEGI